MGNIFFTRPVGFKLREVDLDWT